MATDIIRIHELELQCIVGIWPAERLAEQRIVLDAELELDARLAGRSGKIADTIDYSQVADAITAMLRFRRYYLMEVAAHELSAMLLCTQPHLKRVRLRLNKPEALAGRARAASVEVSRTRTDFPAQQLSQLVGSHSILSSEDAELYLVHVPPLGSWQALDGQQKRCLNWIIQGRLIRDGRELLPGFIEGAEDAELLEEVPIAAAPPPCWQNPESTAAVVFRCIVSSQTQ